MQDAKLETQSTIVTDKTTLDVWPPGGPAPLRVTFSYPYDVASTNYTTGTYEIDFGDGTTAPMTVVGMSIQVTHTYLVPGSYRAVLKDPSSNLASTQVIYVSKGNSSQTSAAISVPGMEKYTDPDFGFSFWYPSGWKVALSNTPSNQIVGLTNIGGGKDSTVDKTLEVSNGRHLVYVQEIQSPSGIYDICGKCSDHIHFADPP